MISIEEFEKLVNRSESSTLDFKKDIYNFEDDNDFRKTAEFIKDIVSFSNTVRTESAFIVFGVSELPDKTKELIGITKVIDESILQSKMKDKVHPRPEFNFYLITYSSLQFGIIEIPVFKYDTPILPTVKMKGLDPGRVYYRRGSSNTEALALETVMIDEWLRSLPGVTPENVFFREVAILIKEFASDTSKLSMNVSELYSFSKSNRIQNLIEFCKNELQGVTIGDHSEEVIEYRILSVFVTPFALNLSPVWGVTEQMVREQFKANQLIFTHRILFCQPLVRLEELLHNFPNDTSVGVFTDSVSRLFEKDGKYRETYVYFLKSDIKQLLLNIRQKAIDLLMKI